jgi:hypothetical protein
MPFLFWSGIRIYRSITFNINCQGHLKRAADANTVDLAKQELKVALAYMEQENMTGGYTSVLYRTPDEDVGFWHTNLTASLTELENLKPDAPPLERSNMLIKLRETLVDHTQYGEKVTLPNGISVFPNNGSYALFGIVGAIVGVVGVYLIFFSDDYY